MTVLILAGATLLAIAVIIALHRPPRDRRWCFGDGDRMRRYVNGEWQDRPQTEAERREALDAEIW